MKTQNILTVSILSLGIIGYSPITTAASIFYEDFQTYDGSGFDSTPTVGMLDSDNWSATGMSDGTINFGSSCTTGDCARGSSTGDVLTSGFYSFNTGEGNQILGWQASTSDFTPGSIVLKIDNNLTSTLTDISVGFDIWTLNNGSSSSSLGFSYSSDNSVFTPISSLNFNTTEPLDTLGWDRTPKSIDISGLNILSGSSLYLRWDTDDFSGSDARDELGIDNISVSSVPIPSAVWLFGSGLIGLIGVARRKKV